MSAKGKKLIIFGTLASVLAIGFVVLYYLNVIKTLDSFLSLTYVAYFVSLSITFVGSYQKECGHKTATKLCYLFGLLILLGATVMLIYGFSTGLISFIN